ncbi:hypothetical protein ACFWR6_06880 [Streptomyces griseus]|uniref:hypothetical protein n=1 Tax=Streptomyces griseus TaxID=1911 RepID=UPI0036659127
MTDIFTTTDIAALADLIAIDNESLCLADLHPKRAGRYRYIANDLTAGSTPRTAHAIAESIALVVEDTGDLDQIAPWDFARHLDTARDILRQF